MLENVNLSIASLPALLVLSALPHWYSISLAQRHKIMGGWTNQNPRAFVARLNAKAASGKKLNEIEEKILRGQSAQQNGFEWWPIWAITVVFGYLSKQSTADMNRFTMIHVVMRILYNILYVNTSSRKFSFLRTAVFQVSVYPTVVVLWRAAKLLA